MTNCVTLFLLASVAVIVTPMPTSSPDIRDIAATATQACPSVENNETERLNVFHAERMEAIELINTILHNNSQWINVLGESKETYCADKTANFNVQVVDHGRLSDVQNSRLRALLQMSNYAHFLKSQDNRTVDYADATTHLHDLWKKINTIIYTIGQLLPTVACDDITLYTEEGVSGHVITASPTTSSDKRSFCYCVLELMLRDCQSLLTSIEAIMVNV